MAPDVYQNDAAPAPQQRRALLGQRLDALRRDAAVGQRQAAGANLNDDPFRMPEDNRLAPCRLPPAPSC